MLDLVCVPVATGHPGVGDGHREEGQQRDTGAHHSAAEGERPGQSRSNVTRSRPHTTSSR